MALDLSNLEKPGVKAAGAVPTPAATLAEAPAVADPIEELILSDKIGGKKVRGSIPKHAQPVEPAPEPDKFAAAGGKYVGKIPAAMPPAKY
jgi:hypothetical protein